MANETASPTVHYRVHHDPRSSHQQISSLVRELQLSPILDVGCAQGMLGHLVGGNGLILDGVDANPNWAAMARAGNYRNVWSSYVQDAPLPDKEYRLVVCGDILEHTPDPVDVIRRLREAAADDATFIISVPNIAHLAVRLMLLFGKFPKMERGPLDKTHLQFLTKDTAREMVEAAGLKIVETKSTVVALDEVFRNSQGKLWYKLVSRLQHVALGIAPRVFGYQWIMICKNA